MKLEKTILITGGSGFIGSNFLEFAKKENLKNNKYTIISHGHKKLDISNLEHLKRAFNTYTPDVIINFAAHRDVNSAEKQNGKTKGSVWKTNVIGIENLEKVSSEYGSFLVQISTDMVFPGNKENPGPYNENSKPEEKIKNLSWYGWTKAEGERRIANSKNAALIRIGNVTLPVYDPKLDYLGKMLYLYDRNLLYPLFNDQHLTLTYIPSLFETLTSLIDEKKSGIFHVASTNTFTPQEIAGYLVKKTRKNTKPIKGISIDEYLRKFPNRYPKHGGLLTKKTQKKLKKKFLTWEKIIDLYVSPKLK